MLKELDQVQVALPGLLADRKIWKSLLIDYRNPIVERLYTDWNGLRISLHCIQPCTAEEAFFHPHPWPSAILILEGGYEMGVACGEGLVVPPNAMTLVLAAGSRYEMNNRDGWHYVRPREKASYSVMVNGRKWDRAMPDFPSEPLQPLLAERVDELLSVFACKLAEVTPKDE